MRVNEHALYCMFLIKKIEPDPSQDGVLCFLCSIVKGLHEKKFYLDNPMHLVY